MALDRSMLSVVGFWLLADFVCCWLQVAVEAGNINFSVPRLAPKIVCLTQGARTYTHPTHPYNSNTLHIRFRQPLSPLNV